MVGHTVGWVKMAVLKVPETTIELGNLKVLYQTTSNLKGFFLTRIGMNANMLISFKITKLI
jgi:hypothetical protein